MTDTLARIADIVDNMHREADRLRRTNRHDAAQYVTGYADNLTTILEKSQP
ncbi:hypothetical protein ACWDTG_06835 [Rhodococcus zopfii]